MVLSGLLTVWQYSKYCILTMGHISIAVTWGSTPQVRRNPHDSPHVKGSTTFIGIFGVVATIAQKALATESHNCHAILGTVSKYCKGPTWFCLVFGVVPPQQIACAFPWAVFDCEPQMKPPTWGNLAPPHDRIGRCSV